MAPTHTRTHVVLVVFRALTLCVARQAQPKIIENGNYLYDSFNPAARDFVFNAVSKGYLQYAPLCGGCNRRLLRQTLTLPQHRYGIKTYWLDADEPERTLPDESGEYHYHAGQDTEVGMAYPREHQRMASQGLQAAGHPLGDFIMLSRSAWAGSASLGAAMWSGDIQSLFSVSAWCPAHAVVMTVRGAQLRQATRVVGVAWQELAIQVKVAQNVAMSGIYWWTTDIGGYKHFSAFPCSLLCLASLIFGLDALLVFCSYANGDPTSPEFRELIVRWYQVTRGMVSIIVSVVS